MYSYTAWKIYSVVAMVVRKRRFGYTDSVEMLFFEKFAYKLLRFRVQTHLEDVGDGQRLFYYFPVAAFVRANTADFS